jgi:hypothetical protein
MRFTCLLIIVTCFLSSKNVSAQIAIEGVAPFYKVIDGPDQDLAPLVLDECKKLLPFAQVVKLIKDDKPFWLGSRKRDYECHIVDLDKDTVRPSSLQQRVMQTRKFNKPYDEVHSAITSWAKDAGATHVSPANPKAIKIDGSSNLLSINGNMVQFSYAGLNLIIDFELNPKSASITEVRVRTKYAGPAKNNRLFVNTETFSQNHYQKIFNGIAQQMFIEAIEIDPLEVQ